MLMKYPVSEAPWLAFIRVCRTEKLSAMEKLRDKDRANAVKNNDKCFEGSEKYEDDRSGDYEPQREIGRRKPF